MGKVYERIDGRLREFVETQPMFFVATAPLSADGRVNLSPKGGLDTFAVFDEHTVAYLDLGGSRAETIAHLRENGRRSCGARSPARRRSCGCTIRNPSSRMTRGRAAPGATNRPAT